MKKKLVTLLLATAMTVTSLVGCGSSSSNTGSTGTDASANAEAGTTADAAAQGSEERDPNEKIDVLNQTEKMTLSIVCLQGHTQPDSQIEKWMEERYNLDINVIALPGWSDAVAKISLLMADEEQRPDIIWWWNMEQDFVEWVDAGLLVDVSPEMDKYTNMRDYYNSQDEAILFFASSKDGKMYRIPGDVAEPSCETLWIRQDWLDNLGLEVPKTLDELDDVLYKFTFDDPDGNGVDDTYGLGGDGLDFRSFWPWVQGSGTARGLNNQFMINEDGSFVYGPASDDTKIWLERVAKLYQDGVITPNIITDTDREEVMANGGFGVTYGWITYSNPSNATMTSFYSTNPDAKWVPIEMVSGDNGDPQDNACSVGAWCYFGITNKCSDPERAYAIWDDMATPENYIHRRFGVEGEHYVKNDDGSYEILISNSGTENTEQNIGLKLFADLFSRKDFCNIENTPETTALYERAKEQSRDAYSHMIEKKDPSAYVVWNEKGADIEAEVTQYQWGVIAGEKSLDDWDAHIQAMKDAGLDEVMEELNELYPQQQEAMKAYLAE